MTAGAQRSGAQQHYQGAARIHVRYLWGTKVLPLALEFVFAALEQHVSEVALLDTGSDYCVMRPDMARRLGIDPSGEPADVRVITPLGFITGSLQECQIHVTAVVGEDLVMEVPWLVTEDRPGPAVLGWTGFLEAMAFGCNPGVRPEDEPLFYFSAL